MSATGYTTWVFTDGDLPPRGDGPLPGHEALIITNTGTEDANVTVDILFAEDEPKKGIKLLVKAERVLCIRLDLPFGEPEYQIPFGQYSLVVRSNVPVVASFGRLDVRQPNMAYYSVTGFGC
ncbi:MAG: hypothetical protein IJY82_05005 [Oscillospiraceae bacterium]|nr:sensory rhodopsin transducer [Oscillospiraceae bacterium]MBQ8732169.1 hypothetical protein [Oscillospiraceae bacterium]